MNHISYKNVKIIKNIDNYIDKENPSFEKLSENTENTWQKNRNLNEKKADTSIGKLAEEIFVEYLKKNLTKIIFFTYDSFRKDNYKKHAPFDGIILKKNYDRDNIIFYAKKINQEIKNSQYGKISDTLKNNLEKNEIYTVEIKSTRITGRHKKNNSSKKQIIENILLNDDFLDYPKHLRTDKYNNIHSINDYINFCKKNKNLICEENNCENKIREIEKKNMKYYYIRIYIDEVDKIAYIIGFIDKDFFSRNFNIKHMSRKAKSEKALYLAASLKHAKNIDELNKKFKIS